MMNGGGKSDIAIVAVKPANKAERSAAELGEPRAMAEGNGEPAKHVPGAASGLSVSQALERIRQAARREEKLTALFHHLSVALFREAFFELKKDAAAGVDGVTWRDFERNLEGNLQD